MNSKESEEVKARDARLKKILEKEGDFRNQEQVEKDSKKSGETSDPKKT